MATVTPQAAVGEETMTPVVYAQRDRRKETQSTQSKQSKSPIRISAQRILKRNAAAAAAAAHQNTEDGGGGFETRTKIQKLQGGEICCENNNNNNKKGGGVKFEEQQQQQQQAGIGDERPCPHNKPCNNNNNDDHHRIFEFLNVVVTNVDQKKNGRQLFFNKQQPETDHLVAEMPENSNKRRRGNSVFVNTGNVHDLLQDLACQRKYDETDTTAQVGISKLRDIRFLSDSSTSGDENENDESVRLCQKGNGYYDDDDDDECSCCSSESS